MTRRTPAQYDWSKLEFDETLLTKHFTKQSSKKVRYIVAHHMTIVGNGKGSALDAAYKTWQTREASAHYGVDGTLIRQYVWDKDYAWATGNTDGNRYGISIEHANSTAAPKWLVSEATWKTGARLAAHLHKVYKLGRPVSGKTLRKHSSFVATACPGPYLGGSQWAAYVKEAQRVYDEITKPASKPTPTPAPKPATPKPSVPATKTATVRAGFHNVSGYNPTGFKTFVDRILRKNGLAAVLRTGDYDVYGYAELSGVDDSKGRDMVRTLTEAANPVMKRAPGGGKGTHVFYNPKTTTLITSGQIELHPLWKGNDKQAAWAVLETAGIRHLYAAGHLTPQDPTEKTPIGQLHNGIDQLVALAKKHKVPPTNIMFMLDGNIERDTTSALAAKGWKLANKRASKVVNGAWKTFTGWRPQSKGIQIDIAVCPEGLELGEFANVRDNKLADHNRIRIAYTITSK